MGSSGLGPPTSRLSGVRSNQLSYRPVFRLFLTRSRVVAAMLCFLTDSERFI